MRTRSGAVIGTQSTKAGRRAVTSRDLRPGPVRRRSRDGAWAGTGLRMADAV